MLGRDVVKIKPIKSLLQRITLTSSGLALTLVFLGLTALIYTGYLTKLWFICLCYAVLFCLYSRLVTYQQILYKEYVKAKIRELAMGEIIKEIFPSFIYISNHADHMRSFYNKSIEPDLNDSNKRDVSGIITWLKGSIACLSNDIYIEDRIDRMIARVADRDPDTAIKWEIADPELVINISSALKAMKSYYAKTFKVANSITPTQIIRYLNKFISKVSKIELIDIYILSSTQVLINKLANDTFDVDVTLSRTKKLLINILEKAEKDSVRVEGSITALLR